MSKHAKPHETGRTPESPGRESASAELARRHVRFGWWTLLIYLALGIGLEALHAFKIEWYAGTQRHMWTLAHAHGTLMALVHMAFAASVPWFNPADSRWRLIGSPCLYGATLTLPTGFFLGGLYTYGVDPGLGIFLVPLGGLLLLIAVLLSALASRRG